MFKVGQKVVCVFNFPSDFNQTKTPKKGFVYEIDYIEEFKDGDIGLGLNGFNDLSPEDNLRIVYDIKGFKAYVDPQLEMNKVKEELIDKELILN